MYERQIEALMAQVSALTTMRELAAEQQKIAQQQAVKKAQKKIEK